MKRLFSSSEDEKEDTPELITLEEEEQKEIDALGNDTEDEAKKTTKVKDFKEEKNEVLSIKSFEVMLHFVDVHLSRWAISL